MASKEATSVWLLHVLMLYLDINKKHMTNIKLNTYESNPEWNSMEIFRKHNNWHISSYSDGDVEIECHTDHNGSEVLILNQDELRQVIAFLQTKLK